MIKIKDLPEGLRFFHPASLIATFGGVGLLRPAPGTMGSLAGLIAAFFIPLHYLPILCALFFGVGVWASRVFETASGQKDNQSIVIDEVCGVWIVILLSPFTTSILTLILCFVLFRVFDIWKPWPIRNIETKLSKGWDVMADDLAAAGYAFIVLIVLSILINGGVYVA